VLVGTGRSPFVPSPAQELTRDLAGYQAAGVHVLTPHGQTLNLGAGAPRPVSITPTTFIYRLAGAAPLFTASGCGVSSSRTAVATVVCSHPSELIRRETSMKGWSASVNGRSTPIHTVAGLFQAIRLPAGHDRVTFSFSPPYIVWAWLAFLIGGVWFLVTVGFAAAAWREQLNPPGVSTSAHGVREAQE
jgi:hypothetical protein